MGVFKLRITYVRFLENLRAHYSLILWGTAPDQGIPEIVIAAVLDRSNITLSANPVTLIPEIFAPLAVASKPACSRASLQVNEH